MGANPINYAILAALLVYLACLLALVISRQRKRGWPWWQQGDAAGEPGARSWRLAWAVRRPPASSHGS